MSQGSNFAYIVSYTLGAGVLGFLIFNFPKGKLFNRMGYKHLTVTGFYCAVAVIQGIGAMWMVTISGLDRLLVFVPFLIFQVIYSIIIIKYARKRGLMLARAI